MRLYYLPSKTQAGAGVSMRVILDRLPLFSWYVPNKAVQQYETILLIGILFH